MRYAWQRFDVNMDGDLDIADPVATLKQFGEGDGRLRVRCMTVRFADYNRPFSAEAAHGIFLGEGVIRAGEWLKKERGIPTDRGLDIIDCGVLYSHYNQTDLGTPDIYGEGMGGDQGDGNVLSKVVYEEFGLAGYSGKEWWRNAVMVLGGGGMAVAPGQLSGAMPVTSASINAATAMIGDWAVFPWLGEVSQGCLANNADRQACTSRDTMLRVVGHELGHTFAMHDDQVPDSQGNPVTVNGAWVWHTNYVGPDEAPGANPHVAYGGLPLSPDQKRFIRHPLYDRWLK